MPAWLVEMRRILSSIFEWIGRAGRHVQSGLVLRLVTIAAFHREDTVTVRPTPKAERGVRATILALEWGISRRVTIDAPRMHEYLIHF